jgi:hypothetical protein
MSAVMDGAARRDRALELVRERIGALARGSRVTLVRSGPRPSLLAGPAAFPSEAGERLEAWQPLAARHDLQPALALALELAGGGKVLVVTDHYEPDAWPDSVELASVGAPADNACIAHAARSRELGADGRVADKAFLTIANYSRAARRVSVAASAGERKIATKELELEPRGRAHLSFEVPEGAGVIEVRLPPDALALDDRALLAPPASRTIALASALDEETERALGLAGPGERNLDRWLGVVPLSIDAGSPAQAHLVLARGAVDAPAAWSFVFEAQGEPRRDLIGPFLGERGHPLLEGATLEGLVWSIDPELALPGAPIVCAGNVPILTEERSGERITWHANLDPARSSLQRSPDWPILLANMAELRRAVLPGPERTNLSVGESLRYRPGSEVPPEARVATLVYELEGPLGEPNSAKREAPAIEEVVVDGLEEPGLYSLSYAGREVAQFALSFSDAAESDLTAARSGARPSELALAALESEMSWIELALIVLALAAIGLDWYVLQRALRTFRGAS